MHLEAQFLQSQHQPSRDLSPRSDDVITSNALGHDTDEDEGRGNGKSFDVL